MFASEELKTTLEIIKVLYPTLLLIIGWFVILNSAKHIATRSEAKIILNDITSSIKEKLEEASNHWVDYRTNGKKPLERAFYLQKSLIFIGYLRQQKELLNNYDIEAFDEEHIVKLKLYLTETPDSEVNEDAIKRQCFTAEKITNLTRQSYSIIKFANNEYTKKFKPTNEPLLKSSAVLVKRWFKFLFLAIVLFLFTAVLF